MKIRENLNARFVTRLSIQKQIKDLINLFIKPRKSLSARNVKNRLEGSLMLRGTQQFTAQ
jgi:hypothetical protein